LLAEGSFVKLDQAIAYQGTKVVPNLRDVGVEADGARICIKRIAILVYLVIKNPNGAPEGRIPPIAIDRLLVSLIGLRKFLLGHVATAEEIPTLSILIVWHHR
jgi:hypothetical protein